MNDDMQCYLVEVNTTNSMRDCYDAKGDEQEDGRLGDYHDCEDGQVYIVAPTMKKALTLFGPGVAVSIRRIGLGRALRGGEEKR